MIESSRPATTAPQSVSTGVRLILISETARARQRGGFGRKIARDDPGRVLAPQRAVPIDRPIVRSDAPQSCLSRRISRTRRIDALSAGIDSPPVMGP